MWEVGRAKQGRQFQGDKLAGGVDRKEEHKLKDADEQEKRMAGSTRQFLLKKTKNKKQVNQQA